jgi:hypothetical protein
MLTASKQRVASAGVTLQAQKQDPRIRATHQIQKINSAFYGTLRANTINKNNYEDLV